MIFWHNRYWTNRCWIRKRANEVLEMTLSAIFVFWMSFALGASPPSSSSLNSKNGLSEASPKATQPSVLEQIVPFVFIFLLFYFLLIRPAQKRQRRHQNLLDKLQKGDQVVTSSGILGTIYGLTNEFITLEIAENVRIKLLRSQISSLRKPSLLTNISHK